MSTLIRYILQFLLRDYYADFSLWWFFFRHTPIPSDKKLPRILVLDHVFEQDIVALTRVNSSYTFIVMSAFHLRNIATLMFPPAVENYDFYNSPQMAAKRKRWRTIMDRFVRRLQQRYLIQGVIAPSDNFFYVRELIPALQVKHIPYVVIDKEGTICPAYFIHFAQYIRDHCPLIADHILVWSERQKQFWKKTGVTAERITVTGQPRSDYWRQPDRWKTKDQLGLYQLRSTAPLFLFFTYDPWAYTPDYMVEKGEMHWDKLRNETHRTLFAFAHQHPEIDLIIKAHPQQTDLDLLRQEILQSGCANVFLVTGVSLSNDLIVNADCVIGFQTTALIEAMVTDKPIIYTFWGEAKDRWSADLIPFHETNGVTTVTSPAALTTQLELIVSGKQSTNQQRSGRDEFVREYFTIVDGHSSDRTLAALQVFLEKYHDPATRP